jgi:heme/copper-type cytochrome/quinol oxidase subunit 2
MTDRIVEVHSDGGGGSGALMVLAVVLVLIVAVAVLYFAGVFRRGPAKHQIDVNINKPGVVLQLR